MLPTTMHCHAHGPLPAYFPHANLPENTPLPLVLVPAQLFQSGEGASALNYNMLGA